MTSPDRPNKPTASRREFLKRSSTAVAGTALAGAVVPRVHAAEANEIPYQLAAEGRATGTDANAIQVNRAGVATGLVSIPNRYMHSAVEMVSLEDLDQSAELLARFASSLEPGRDFTP